MSTTKLKEQRSSKKLLTKQGITKAIVTSINQ